MFVTVTWYKNGMQDMLKKIYILTKHILSGSPSCTRKTYKPWVEYGRNRTEKLLVNKCSGVVSNYSIAVIFFIFYAQFRTQLNKDVPSQLILGFPVVFFYLLISNACCWQYITNVNLEFDNHLFLLNKTYFLEDCRFFYLSCFWEHGAEKISAHLADCNFIEAIHNNNRKSRCSSVLRMLWYTLLWLFWYILRK